MLIIQPDLAYNDDTDEEEVLLRAALEQKQRQRLARQQIRQQQLEQQRYKVLLRQERARQLAIAQAQAQYQVEQEAIQRYKRTQWIQQREQQQQQQQQQHQKVASIEALVIQHVRKAQQEEAAYSRAKAQAIADAKRQGPLNNSGHVGDESDSDEDLSHLLEALFFPQQKRSHPQEESYPCKRHHQYCTQQGHGQKGVNDKAKEQQDQTKSQGDHKKNEVASSHEEFYDALPAVLSFVDALFGGVNGSTRDNDSLSSKAESSSATRKSSASATASANADFSSSARDSAPVGSSFSQLTPELKAADILRQRQQQQQHQTLILQQKHSELNLIESALDSFSHNLTEALNSVVTEENKRIVLFTEENVSKSMLQIDAIESDGDLSVRKRRKELIKKSQDMLDLVDTCKNRESNTGKNVVRSEVGGDSQLSSQTSETETEVVVELEVQDGPADIVDPLAESPGKQDRDREDDDKDEVIEPYSFVETTSTLSPTESTTVQDNDPTEHRVVATGDETRVDGLVEDEDTIEDDGSASVKSSESSESNESTHDDYEIVPGF
ncbi:hypothetical protein BGZ65_005788 [Modicella reniformis]|uniref:BAG domain-containing protein n=1 Tax=Modicella reniformis TaxID=1440133 RepID=A0A9P6M2N9_9FUNG|nr:hypothetical protein BGZ65_005788 [Modicella reniformis]